MGFGSIFKKLGKVVGKVAASPIGGIALGLIPGGGIVSTLARTALGGLAQKAGGAVSMPGGAMIPGGPFVRGFAGGASFPGQPGFQGAARAAGFMAPAPVAGFLGSGASGSYGGGACPPGWHLDKRTRSRCVRNRHMNPGNARAARRSIQRIKGARKLLRSIESQLPKRHNPGNPRRIARRR
jgi:hypothetical protein